MTPVLSGQYPDMNGVLLAERTAINVEHGLAGAWLVKNWAYPETFAEICEHHHEPLHPKDSALLRVVKMACRIADALGYSAVQYRAVATYEEVLADQPAFFRRETFPSEEEMRNNVKARLRVFEVTP